MARILGVVCGIALLVGCTGSDSVVDDSNEVEWLQAEVESLEAQLEASEEMVQAQSEELEAARQTADTAEIADDEGECCEELAHCEGLLFPPDDEEWPPPSPDVWFPEVSGYITNESTISIHVFASGTATVMVSGITAVPSSDRWVDGNMIFAAEVPLTEGSNDVEVTVGDEVFKFEVVRNSDLVRGYGRILDVLWSWGEEYHSMPEGVYLGIDFGVMDFEPEYGQGDFHSGDVVVEFKTVTPATVAIIRPPYESEAVLRGEEDVTVHLVDRCLWGDVWNVLLDGDDVVQMEGPVPLGD